MAAIELRHVYKYYEDGVAAVQDFNLEIEKQEFVVLSIHPDAENQQHSV